MTRSIASGGDGKQTADLTELWREERASDSGAEFAHYEGSLAG